jgi:hypothetical protein
VDVRASALAVLFLVGIESTPVEPLVLDVDDPPIAISMSQPVIPDAARPQINLDAVWWTAPRGEPLGLLAERWGMKDDTLRSLNPDFRGDRVEAGQRLAVYRQRPGAVSRSVGAPNRGRLENGVPFVEGKYWQLRSYRPRSYATRGVVVHLATALQRWGARFPDAKPVKLGEFSKRGGGRLKPHSSHRTGRDVDVGYVVHEPAEGPRFRRATDETLDAEATWGLVHSLIANGGIEYIFMNAYVQRMLLPFAQRDLPPEDLPRYFSVAAEGHAAQSKAVLKHWRGHDDHMHVRFACTPIDLGCREAKRRKKKRGRRR